MNAPLSTQNLQALPDIATFKRRMQSLAVLDAIFKPDWESRIHSFNRRWGSTTEMGSTRDGQGDELYVTFEKAGCWMKGVDLQVPVYPLIRKSQELWERLFVGVPEPFRKHIKQSAFETEYTTFCIWRLSEDTQWHRGTLELPTDHHDPDGSVYLLKMFDGNPETYHKFATIHFSATTLTLEHIQHIYEHKRVTKKLAKEINPKFDWETLKADLDEIGYRAN